MAVPIEGGAPLSFGVATSATGVSTRSPNQSYRRPKRSTRHLREQARHFGDRAAVNERVGVPMHSVPLTSHPAKDLRRTEVPSPFDLRRIVDEGHSCSLDHGDPREVAFDPAIHELHTSRAGTPLSSHAALPLGGVIAAVAEPPDCAHDRSFARKRVGRTVAIDPCRVFAAALLHEFAHNRVALVHIGIMPGSPSGVTSSRRACGRGEY